MNFKGFLITLFLLLIGMNTQAAPDIYQGPDIVGTQKDTPEGSSATIYLSKKGQRIDAQSDVGEIIMAFNSTTKACWILNKKKNMYTVGKVKGKSAECDAMGMFDQGDTALGGLISIVPCRNYEKKTFKANEKLYGRAVERWLCISQSQGMGAMQWFDKELKLVIKEQTYTGEMSEFINIKKQTVPVSLFAEPTGYKKVDKNTFWTTIMQDAMKQM